MRMPRRWAPFLFIAIFALLATACSSGSASPSPAASAGGLSVTDAWVRPPMGADVPAAGYLTITNAGGAADALVRVSSPIATSVEMHETMSDASGMTGMTPVDRIEVGAGATVKLEPGGYHLMLMGVTQMPTVGATVELKLTFEKAGDVVVQAQVKAG